MTSEAKNFGFQAKNFGFHFLMTSEAKNFVFHFLMTSEAENFGFQVTNSHFQLSFPILISTCHFRRSCLIMATNNIGKGYYGMVLTTTDSPLNELPFYIVHDSELSDEHKADPRVKIKKLLGLNPHIMSYVPGSMEEPGTLTDYEYILFKTLAAMNNQLLDIYVQMDRDEEDREWGALARFNTAIPLLLGIIDIENEDNPVDTDEALAVSADMTLEHIRRVLMKCIQNFFYEGDNFYLIRILMTAYEIRNRDL